jgi:Tol biopolymer transport system component
VSPDGGRIAFVSTSASHGLVVMDADGTSKHLVVDGSEISDVSSIAWSPDGSRIAFEGNGPRGVYVVGVDGSDIHLLARSATRPYWSPDGTEIVFERAGLNVIDPDGMDRRWVGSYPSGPWAP